MAHNGRRNGRFWAVDEAEAINNIIYNPNEVGNSAKQHLAGHIDAIISGNLIQLGPTSKSTAAAKAIDMAGNNVAVHDLKSAEIIWAVPSQQCRAV